MLLASALKSDIQKLSDAHAVDTHLKFVERIFILFGSNEHVRLFPEKIYKELTRGYRRWINTDRK